MSSFERNSFVVISVIAVVDLLALSRTASRFISAGYGGDFFNLFPFVTLLCVILYAWVAPMKLLRMLDDAATGIRSRLYRSVFGLSLVALMAVQTGLMLTRTMR